MEAFGAGETRGVHSDGGTTSVTAANISVGATNTGSNIAVGASAKNGTTTLKNVVEFKKNLDHKIISLGSRAKLAEELIKIMFVTPVINTHFANESLNVSYGKTSRLIKEMISLGILKEKKGLGRVQYFELDGYLNLFK